MEYVSEQEQIDKLRRFLREYRFALLGGLVVGLLAFGGWTTWQQQKVGQTEAASMEFLGMSENMMQGQFDSAEKHAARIVGQFADTPYAALASLAQARIKMEKGDMAAAYAHLKWAMDNSDDPAVRELAQLRLARVLVAQGKHDDALSMLADAGDYYTSSVLELRGDIQLVKKNAAEALKAYREAFAKMEDTGTSRKSLLQMKIEDLGGNVDSIKKAE